MHVWWEGGEGRSDGSLSKTEMCENKLITYRLVGDFIPLKVYLSLTLQNILF